VLLRASRAFSLSIYPVTTDAALARQASRLRFTDPAQEERFRADHADR